jgi:hypothetical protein
MEMTTTTRTAAILMAVFGLAGCDDATGPAGAGQVEMAAIGNDNTGASQSAAPTGPPQAASGSAEGEVSFSARVYLQTSTGGWVELTEGAARSATVRSSSGAEAATFVRSSIDAGAYSRVRVVFEEVRAQTSSEAMLGIGGSAEGEVHVDASGGPAVVERDLAIRVTANGTTRLVLNLNSDAWMARADSQTRAVARSEFESAVRVYAAAS